MKNIPIAMHPVVSSQLSYVGYDYTKQDLYVTFSKGDTYIYSNVPQNVYDELLASSSIGKYYLSYIRGHYTSTKI